MNISNWCSIESCNPKTISENDIKKIYEIEQDMWAEWIWEYVKCKCCSKVFWKRDVFWHLSKNIFKETVWKIEELLSIDSIKCDNCDSDTYHLWWTDYLDEIRKRYEDDLAYLTLYRDSIWEIRGFSDWYINDFDTIYNREFSSYYDWIWKEKIKKIMELKLWFSLPKEIFVWSSIWIEENYRSFFVLFNMIKLFFNSFDEDKNNILWIAESELWTNTHGIFQTVWAKWIWLNEWDYKELIWNKKDNSENDIFVHPNCVKDYKREFSFTLREFLRKNWKSMKKIIK